MSKRKAQEAPVVSSSEEDESSGAESDAADDSDDDGREGELGEEEAAAAAGAAAVIAKTKVEGEERSAKEPALPKNLEMRDHGKRVIVILENAALETVKTNKGFQLLNAEDHRGVHKKLKREPAGSRPDICHLELMALLDSPLNKAGLLQVFISTKKNVLIEVNPKIRLPRTYKRFAGLMVQLLHKLKIRASEGPQWLLRVVKNPVTRHLPTRCQKYGMSCVGALVDAHEFVPSLPQDEPVVFVIGAMAHGHLDKTTTPYVQEFISVSEYPLSGAKAIDRLLGAFEKNWGIL